MPPEFVHLHCHSEFSLLDGLGRIPDLLGSAKGLGMPALALTDHGTMFGAIDFYEKGREIGVKPIIGCEVYVADRPLDAEPAPDARSYHLVLLAENEVGYRNLIQLTTQAHLRGFYRKPRIDDSLLEHHAEGLICLSGCASSEVARLILQGDLSAASERVDWFHQLFGDRYYLELQNHELEVQKQINEGIVQLSQKLGLPLAATNDVHYVHADQATPHEVLLCIQTQTTLADPKRMRFDSREFYLKSAEQMFSLFSEHESAISNTLVIAERCNLDLLVDEPRMPKFQTPDGSDPEEHLRSLCEAGLQERYAVVNEPVRDRLDYELSVIAKTGFVDYFLLVHDAIRFARDQGIAIGPGRGSTAASLVSYCLQVTNIDPIEHGLSFERFLNPERVSMPDMDLDFADDRRDEVIEYVADRYGRDRVAQIITFGTLKPRAGVRDVGRAMGMSYPDVDRVAKLMPFMCNSVASAKEEVPQLRALYDGDPAMKRLLDTVEQLEGVARHASTHAAGVVISDEPLTTHLPLYRVPKSGQVTTQYPMNAVEKIGLLKIDFLGLRTLTLMERARKLVRQSTGQDLAIERIPLDDPAIYELLSTGETFGVFQVDGTGMRQLLRELHPTEFNHIVAIEALYRPGPMDFIDEFVARKNGQREVKYDHPALEEVLKETYGIVVYQDQVMHLAAKIAGYSMGEADLLRRAMGKKKPQELAMHRNTFIERAGKLGTDAATAEHLFNVIEPFAGYAFNKAHSAAYAVITCQTAYLKAHHPREFMAGLLSAERENSDRVAEAMAECRRLGIAILPPDINKSELDFTIEGEAIRFGLSGIKHVGSGAIESILQNRREHGEFKSLDDLSRRLDWTAVNKRVLESLVRSGALDSLGGERGRLLANVDRLISYGSRTQRAAASGQGSLFGGIEVPLEDLQLTVADPASVDEKLNWELELLGIMLSPHPLTEATSRMEELGVLTVEAAMDAVDRDQAGVGGLVRASRSFSTKDGRPMATFQLSNLRQSLEVVVFSRNYEKLRDRIVNNAIVVVMGKVDSTDGRLRLLADDVFPLDESDERLPLKQKSRGSGSRQSEVEPMDAPVNQQSKAAEPVRLLLELTRTSDREADMSRALDAYAALQRYPGSDEVSFYVRTDSGSEPVPLPNATVCACEELEREVEALGISYRSEARVSA